VNVGVDAQLPPAPVLPAVPLPVDALVAAPPAPPLPVVVVAPVPVVAVVLPVVALAVAVLVVAPEGWLVLEVWLPPAPELAPVPAPWFEAFEAQAVAVTSASKRVTVGFVDMLP